MLNFFADSLYKKKMEFIELINEAINILKKEKEENKIPMFEDRFLKMIEYCEKLKTAYQINTMNNNSMLKYCENVRPWRF